MKVVAQEVQVNHWNKTGSPLGNLQKAVTEACGRKSAPIRVALVSKNRLGHTCEMEAVAGAATGSKLLPSSVFDFRRRTW